MAAVSLIVPVSLYFLGVFCTHLLWPDVYFAGRVISESKGFETRPTLASFNVNLVIFFDIRRHMAIRHIGFYKPSTAYFAARVKRYSNSESTFQLERLAVSGDISPNPGPDKCSTCLRSIARNHRVLCCASCSSEYHIKCGGVKPFEYKRMQQFANQVWICPMCISRHLMEQLPFYDVSNYITESLAISEEVVETDLEQEDATLMIDPLQTARQKNGKDLLVCHLNINSIQNKFEELKDIILKSTVQIMAVSETKIDGSYPDCQFLIPGYYLHRNDRKKGGGGVLMFVSSKIQSKRISIERKYKTIEPLALEIGLKSRNAIVVAIYRPPKKVTGSYQLLLEEELSHISNWAGLQYSTVIMTGDLNLNRLKPDSTEGKLLLDLEVEQGFDCMITTPTRIQMQGSITTHSLIDVILTNQPQLFGDCGVYNPEISDHALVYGFLNEKVKPQKGKIVKFRSFKHLDAEKYKDELMQAPWHVGEIFDTADDKTSFLETLLSSIVDEHLPEKKMRVRTQDVPYMTNEWKKAIRAKRRAAKKYLKVQNRENWEAKRKARNEATRLRRKAIREYWKDQTTKLKCKPGEFYKTFMPFLSEKRNKGTTNELSLNIEGAISHDQSKIANHLCHYFSTIADGIGDTEGITDSSFVTHSSVRNITENMIGHQDFQFRNLEILEVETALESINPRKSTGWDGVPPKAFKLGARELSGPLTALYNSCITLGEWPAVWKKGEWTPVFKKEDPHEKKNYRPITVQVTINKIFEQLLSKQLNYSFNDKLCDKLTAYRKNHSCETALLAMTENWKISLDEHKVVGVLSTDMSKAFDSLYYPLTLAKLKAYGIRGNSLKLLDSYFTDRYNRVKLGSTVSEWERGSRGCPQGSAFGPLIWNMFQNDLTYSVNSNSNINMYADDHQFHAAGSNVTEVHDKLIASAELASRWYRSNFLKGNYDKYQTMTLGNKNNDMDSIIIDDNEVKSTKCLKLLGVYIDNRLQFDEHIANICKRSSQRVGVLMRLRNMIPTDTKLKLFKAAILPYLTYSHLVWHFCRASDTRKLERIQERALRAVYCDKGSSYDKLLDMANLSTLQNRRLQDIAILMYKVKNNLSPNYICSLFQIPQLRYTLRNNDFGIPRFNTVTFGKHSLRYMGPKIWAIVPRNVRELTSISSFKCNIRRIDLVSKLTDSKCENCLLCKT